MTERDLGAFVDHDPVNLAGAERGPLQGLRFAAKDLFAIEGHVTGAGNPDWRRTHEPASATAPAVRQLLDAGAGLIGKTHTDEMAYSLNGENVHYGTPLNPRAPDRIPGGSSSGSASAVAAGAVDFALGTDTGGSVRVPASYCGLFGLRPTHGRLAMEGLHPLAPSFDTVGWFTREGALLRAIGQVLLQQGGEARRPQRLLVAEDAFALLEPRVQMALAPAVASLERLIGPVEEARLAPGALQDWTPHFRILQGHEVWRCHGAWVQAVAPKFGPGIKERFEAAAAVTDAEAAASHAARLEVAARIDGLLAEDCVLCLPTAPDIAPMKNTPPEQLDDFRQRALALTCVAGLSGCPQVNLPLAELDGCPLGISLLGRRGQDEALLMLAEAVDRA